MKYKKALIIIFSILFFLTALTLYINRVVFPNLIKKIAVEHIEETLKRKVEIGSIHFSWVRGFIIDRIKIYEKDSKEKVFAQADQVSFGVLFFPGLKHYRITIPFINVMSPSVHLIRTTSDTWNFSDMYASSMAAAPAAAPIKAEKPSTFEVAWGGITISDGKFLVDDISNSRPWSEYFDNIDLKLSLSYKGISYDFTADIPSKKGLVGATVYYQPLTKNTEAHIHLKNIDTASYLSLIDIPDIHMDSGIIKEIDLNINYTQDKTSAQGDVLMKDLNVTSRDQSFKGDIAIHNLDATYQNGDIKARGQFNLNDVETTVPGLSAGGSVQAAVDAFAYTQEGVAFAGSLHAQNTFVSLKDRQVKIDAIALDNIRIKKDHDGIQSVGSITTKGLFVQWPDRALRGDIELQSMTMNMKDENNILLKGSIQADNFSTNLDNKNFSSRHILLEGVSLNIIDQRNISLETKATLEGMALGLDKNLLTSSSIKTERLSFNLDKGIVKASAILDFAQGKIILDHHKTIQGDPQLELHLQMPLDDPQSLTYKGSITLSDGILRGFSSIQSLSNIELDADFQNDAATINALSINILDTNLRVNGTVTNFKNPRLNIVAEATDLNLAKMKELAPQLVRPLGLSFDGTSVVKVKFDGLIKKPLSAKILAVASVKNASAYSSKLHLNIKNITGIIEATPDSLKWRDFTFRYLGKEYALAGGLDDFHNPQILTTIDGPDLHFNADLVKKGDTIIIRALKGKYLNAEFDNKGTISLLPEGSTFDINTNVSFLLEDVIKDLPSLQRRAVQPLDLHGVIALTANIKGAGLDWKNYSIDGTVTSPIIRLLTYSLTDMKIDINQGDGKIKNVTFDGKLYDGTVHAVGSLDLQAPTMPYDLAFNIDSTDLHKLKMDSPLKMEEINGKFFLTTLAHGTVTDFKNNIQASGSMAIRDGFLAEFNLFRGLLSILNDALHLGQVMITDVEGNFTIANQKINTDNLRLKGPTIVLLGKGWVNFDQMCDLNMTVDLSSGVVPAMAHDVLQSISIHIYDKIANPKFKKKISMPQVINTLLKNLWQ